MHLVRERGQDARTGGAGPMTHEDARPVDLDPLAVGLAESPLAQAREHLRREGLIQLDEVDIGEGEPGPLERGRGGGHRPDAPDLGSDPGDSPRPDA